MSNNTLSKDVTLQAKGILAFLVFAHHLYQVTGIFSGTYLGYLLQAFGYWAVAVFFFLSGYGLTVSYLSKGSEYAKSLLIKKAAPFFTVYIVLIGLYFLIGFAKNGAPPEYSAIWQSFLLGKTIVGNGWYLQVQILLYLIFCVSFTFFSRDNSKKSAAFLVLLCAAYMVSAKAFHLSATYYISVPSFLLGTAFAFPRFKPFFCSRNKMKVFLCFAFAVASLGMYLVWKHLSGHWFSDVFLGLSTLSFSLFFVLFGMLIYNKRFNIGCVGKISFEIYVCQGLAMTFFHSKIVNISNTYLYILACVAATVVIAVLFHYIVTFIFDFWNKSWLKMQALKKA